MLAVILHYSFILPAPPDFPEFWFRAAYHTLEVGSLGVPRFFVISGFCIHLRWAREGRIDYRDFWRRRVRRLYPPYPSCSTSAWD